MYMIPIVMVSVHCASSQWDLIAYEISDISLNTFWVIFQRRFKDEKKRSSNSKSVMPVVMVSVHCTSAQWDLFLNLIFKSVTDYCLSNTQDKIQVWKSTKSTNSKSMMPRVFCSLHFSMRSLMLPLLVTWTKRGCF